MWGGSRGLRWKDPASFDESAFTLTHAVLFHRYVPDMKRKAVQTPSDLRQLSLAPDALLPIYNSFCVTSL